MEKMQEIENSAPEVDGQGTQSSLKRARRPVDRYQIMPVSKEYRSIPLNLLIMDFFEKIDGGDSRKPSKKQINKTPTSEKSTRKVKQKPGSNPSIKPNPNLTNDNPSNVSIPKETSASKEIADSEMQSLQSDHAGPNTTKRTPRQTVFYQAPVASIKRKNSLEDSNRKETKKACTSQPQSKSAYQSHSQKSEGNKNLPKVIVTKIAPESQISSTEYQSSDIGRIVWAKLTARSKAWPAMTIDGSSAAQVPASPDNQWVFWYGEHKVSEVAVCRLEDFDVGFKTSYKPNSGQIYSSAVEEALKDASMLLSKEKEFDTLSSDLQSQIRWAGETFTSPSTILPHGKVTEFVGKRLANIVEMITKAEESSDDAKSNDGVKTPVVPFKKTSCEILFAKVKAKELDIELICIGCGCDTQQVSIREHPLFLGGLCTKCEGAVKDAFFSFGADGCMSFCVVCGNGGELLVCDTQTCCRTYCTECIETLGSQELRETIEKTDPWLCFLCNPLNDSGILIQSRDDWKQRLMSIYQKPSFLHSLPQLKSDRRLRVLSLFDGIGTAKVVLDNLKLDVEVYYSSEIEDSAMQVVNMNHGEAVVQLGDVRSLTEEKLVSLGRIDLIVGGSPCNDLALVNPARKGLYDATGTGILFFDFYRILMTLMIRQPDHSVLWLFENVVHMNKETKETISRFLECEPVKLDAGVFSAQSRARYFWGNIPGMYCPISPEVLNLNYKLQDVLCKGREATVGKIRTVTTRGASLLQGKNEDMHAVVMNGQSDKLWPTELERIFGLPVHYTDAGNLAPGKRQKLLGKSWCVPVIEHLLKPLTHLFAVKNTSDEQTSTCSNCKKMLC